MASVSELQPFLEVPFVVEAVLNGPRLRVGELMALRPGSVIAIGVPAGDNISVTAGDSPIGSAELSVADGRRVMRIVRAGSKR